MNEDIRVHQSCPRCDSKKVVKKGKAVWFLSALMAGSCFFFLGIFFFPFLLLALISFLISPFMLLVPGFFQCGDCNYVWKVPTRKEAGELYEANQQRKRETRIVTFERFPQIDKNMSYEEVVAVMGVEGQEFMNSTDEDGVGSIQYIWDNKDGSQLHITFDVYGNGSTKIYD